MPGLERIIGQEQAVRRLQEFAEHFHRKGQAADHILLVGPRGMGKGTIAKAVAETLGVAMTMCEADALERKGDLTAVLTSLDARNILFLENAHHVRQPLTELLLAALSDYQIDLIIGQGPGARVHPYQLNRFTCLASVERESDMSAKLRDQFPLVVRMQPYTHSELSRIAVLIARGLSKALEPTAASLIAAASQGSPHRSETLIRKLVANDGQNITEEDVQSYLTILGVRIGVGSSRQSAISLDELSGIAFEELVGVLLTRMGFQVETTKITGDGGIDIIACLEKPLLRGRYLVQCKRFLLGNPVGAPSIREFYGAVRADHKAVKGIFITTSSFTEQAKEFAENLAIELIDREKLQQLLAEHGIPC